MGGGGRENRNRTGSSGPPAFDNLSAFPASRGHLTLADLGAPVHATSYQPSRSHVAVFFAVAVAVAVLSP